MLVWDKIGVDVVIMPWSKNGSYLVQSGAREVAHHEKIQPIRAASASSKLEYLNND